MGDLALTLLIHLAGTRAQKSLLIRGVARRRVDQSFAAIGFQAQKPPCSLVFLEGRELGIAGIAPKVSNLIGESSIARIGKEIRCTELRRGIDDCKVKPLVNLSTFDCLGWSLEIYKRLRSGKNAGK